MSFSAAQRAQVIEALGYAGDAETVEQVQQRLSAIEAEATLETRVGSILTTLTAIDGQLIAARNIVGSSYDQLRSEAQRQCYMLSNLLGLEVKRKVYG
ncbi:MAG: hypothetical protein KME16_27965 [Scytolyngbya sp. HA4215-MV1]|nr:hypothetical protein [Scytolyngbya sp. HA4215-MV1]